MRSHIHAGIGTSGQGKGSRGVVVMVLCFVLLSFLQAGAQPTQQIDVTIKNFKFEVTQTPLQLLVPTVIVIRNEDEVRHGFTSPLFQGTLIEVEDESGMVYGQGIDGLYIDPGKELSMRLTFGRSGDYRFHCNLHPDMEGEILLIGVEAV